MAYLKEEESTGSQYYVKSKAHARYLGKQANSKSGKSNELDFRGQPHRATRDESGNIVGAGGGKIDDPPAPNDAAKILMRSAASGIKYDDLPEKSQTANAARKETEHAKMRGKRPPGQDSVVSQATAPPGARHLARQERRKQQQQQRQLQVNSKEYLSKSISEQFSSDLDEALGL